MKSSTKRASPHGQSAQREAQPHAVSALNATEYRMPHTLMFVMADVAPSRREALQAAGFDVVPMRHDAVATAIASADMPCALMWSDPANCLATAIEEGTAIAQVIEGWRERAQEVLALMRKNRRKITLVDVDILTVPDTDPAWEVLRNRLDLPTGLVMTPPWVQAPTGLSQTVARLAVPQIDSLRDLLEELRASGVSPLNEGLAIDSLEAAAAAFEDLRSSRNELALLREQVQIQVREAQRAEETSEALREQHGSLTQDVERLTAAQSALEAQNAKLARDVEDLTTMLSLVYESTSWRVTAPLRGVKRLVSK